MAQTSSPKVTNIQETNIGPNRAQLDKEVASLLPSVLKPKALSFEVIGTNMAIANGLRRAILLELPVYALNIDEDNFITSQKEMFFDFVQQRIRNIPIKQSIDPNTEYELKAMNNEGALIEVKSAQLSQTKGRNQGPQFDETISIAHLYPNKFINIGKIRVVKDKGIVYGGHAVAYSAVSISLDQGPLEERLGPISSQLFAKMGIESLKVKERMRAAESNPRHFRISFETNGTMEPKDIVKLACEEIINRLNSILDSYESNKKEYKGGALIIIPAENDTTGNIIVKTAIDLFPEAPRINYKYEPLNKVLTIDIASDEPKAVLTGAIKAANVHLKAIHSAF